MTSGGSSLSTQQPTTARASDFPYASYVDYIAELGQFDVAFRPLHDFFIQPQYTLEHPVASHLRNGMTSSTGDNTTLHTPDGKVTIEDSINDKIISNTYASNRNGMNR